jgi:hypothetical protein
MHKHTCEACKGEFWNTRKNSATRIVRYCSRECRTQGHIMGLRKRAVWTKQARQKAAERAHLQALERKGQ